MNFDVKFQEESSFAVEMGQLTRGPKEKRATRAIPAPPARRGQRETPARRDLRGRKARRARRARRCSPIGSRTTRRQRTM